MFGWDVLLQGDENIVAKSQIDSTSCLWLSKISTENVATGMAFFAAIFRSFNFPVWCQTVFFFTHWRLCRPHQPWRSCQCWRLRSRSRGRTGRWWAWEKKRKVNIRHKNGETLSGEGIFVCYPSLERVIVIILFVQVVDFKLRIKDVISEQLFIDKIDVNYVFFTRNAACATNFSSSSRTALPLWMSMGLCLGPLPTG